MKMLLTVVLIAVTFAVASLSVLSSTRTRRKRIVFKRGVFDHTGREHDMVKKTVPVSVYLHQ